MSKLTQKQNREVPFELCFKYPLEKGFTFKELSRDNLKQLQSFLDKVARMTVTQVDKSFARPPDKQDKYNDLQVYHYEVAPAFRIHVVIEAGYYKIIRLDPNHTVHKG